MKFHNLTSYLTGLYSNLALLDNFYDNGTLQRQISTPIITYSYFQKYTFPQTNKIYSFATAFQAAMKSNMKFTLIKWAGIKMYLLSDNNFFLYCRKMPHENLSIVNIHYNSVSSTLIRRSVHITWDALLGESQSEECFKILCVFLAAIGGIFGLCLGGSIISLLELLLYILNLFVKGNVGGVPGIKRTYPNRIQVKKGFTNKKPHLNTPTLYME